MSNDRNTVGFATAMAGPDGERVARILLPLLDGLERLMEMTRHLHPGTLPSLAVESASRGEKQRALATELEGWPESLEPLAGQLAAALDNTSSAFEGLRDAPGSDQAVFLAYRALRHVPRALEALYPLAGLLPDVSRFFLVPASRNDQDLLERLSGVAPDGTGILAFGPDLDSRQTFWAYVPETYTPEVAHPLIVALHGGSGKGRSFLYSWLRDARSRGAILIAPTSLGQTWALQGKDIDSPHLSRIVEFAAERWNIDPKQRLMTGMSDGGTFSYVSGLQANSPFTHLAPFSAAFHPMLGSFADPERLKGLPVHVVHGVLDWMFPADMARMAHEWLRTAGARVTYREIRDLSHTYAPELNGGILDWTQSTA